MKRLLSLVVLLTLLLSVPVRADEELSIYQMQHFLFAFPQSWQGYQSDDGSYMFKGPDNEIINVIATPVELDIIDSIGGVSALFKMFYDGLKLASYETEQVDMYGYTGDLWWGYTDTDTPMYGLLFLYKSDWFCISITSTQNVGINMDILHELPNDVLPIDLADMSKLYY